VLLYDPTIYLGAAKYYACGRPPYSRELVSTLTAELGLDGSGRVLDVGCGPGTLTVELAASFEDAIGLDPDADMLSEATNAGQTCTTAGVATPSQCTPPSRAAPDHGMTWLVVTVTPTRPGSWSVTHVRVSYGSCWRNRTASGSWELSGVATTA
jgi:hypothetical protein